MDADLDVYEAYSYIKIAIKEFKSSKVFKDRHLNNVFSNLELAKIRLIKHIDQQEEREEEEV
jgi:hypothetical protein